MNLEHLITQLANQAESIRNLSRGVSAEQARWKPDPESRSILEVINHLYDEEIEDFRQHLDDLLHHPDSPWHSIDPEGWFLSVNTIYATSTNRRQFHSREAKIADVAEGNYYPDWEAGRGSAVWLCSKQAIYSQPGLRMICSIYAAGRAALGVHGQSVQPYNVNYAGDW